MIVSSHFVIGRPILTEGGPPTPSSGRINSHSTLGSSLSRRLTRIRTPRTLGSSLYRRLTRIRTPRTLGSSLCRRLTRIRTPPTGSLALHTRKDGVLAHPISRSPILAHSEAEHAISNAPGARGESQQIVTHMVAMSSPFTHSDSVSDTRHSRVLLGPLC